MAITQVGVQPVVSSVGEAETGQTYRVGEVTDGETVSLAVSCINDLGVDGNMNLVHWRGEGTSYRIYKGADGGFGLVGTTDLAFFIDDGIAPDMGQQPPEA